MILVTGGAGYIGSHTVKQLCNQNIPCVVFDNLENGHIQAIDKRANFIRGCLLDKDSIENVFKQYEIEAVIHFAAYAYVGESIIDPNKYYCNNVLGTLNLLNAMLKHNVKKIVFSSTCATYGEAIYIPIDENHSQNPINPYGMSKLMVEKILADFKKAYDFKYIALRYFNACGACEDGSIGESHQNETHLIPRILMALNGKLDYIEVYGNNYDTEDGSCVRDYIHVDDLASAHILALDKLDIFSGFLNLGTGKGYSVKNIIDKIFLITKLKCDIKYLPKRPGDPSILYADNSKCIEILNWKIKHSSLENIIKTAWYWEKNRTY